MDGRQPAEEAVQWCPDTSGGGAWSGPAGVVVPDGGAAHDTVGARSEEGTGWSGFIGLETASAVETRACGDERFWPNR